MVTASATKSGATIAGRFANGAAPDVFSVNERSNSARNDALVHADVQLTPLTARTQARNTSKP